jgi:hypothetical protein
MRDAYWQTWVFKTHGGLVHDRRCFRVSAQIVIRLISYRSKSLKPLIFEEEATLHPYEGIFSLLRQRAADRYSPHGHWWSRSGLLGVMY